MYYLTAGLCLGSLYALIALGYTMVYGIINLINFAHGEFFMVGAYAGFFCFASLPATWPLWVGVGVAMGVSGLAGGAIGVVTERVAYKPIRKAGRLTALLTAIGVSFLLQNIAAFVRSGRSLSYEGRLGEALQTNVMIGSSGVKVLELSFVPASLLLTAGLWLLVKHTRFGKAMRATSQDHDAALMMGINTNAVIRQTFLVGGVLAGVAGTLWGLNYQITPTMGALPGLNAFVAAVVGGIGSIPGAVLGGYPLGVLQYMVQWAGVPSSYKDIASFVVLILVLVARPQGILGRVQREKV